MDVSIVVVNYNTLTLTKQCVDSVIENTKGLTYEIIIVDNASSDGSKDYFSNRKDIKYFYLESNIGFGRANNIGFSHSKGDFVFFLNSDTFFLNDALALFYKYALELDNWGCIGSQMLTKELNDSPSFGYFMTVKRELISALLSYSRLFLNSKPKVTIHSEDPYEVEVVIGADIFVKRKTIVEMGLFDPHFFMYHEENDLMRRYHEHGLKNYIIPGPKIVHLESQSTKVSFNKRMMSTKSMFVYLKKWSKTSSYLVYRVIYAVLKIPFVLSPSLSFKQRMQFAKLLFAK